MDCGFQKRMNRERILFIKDLQDLIKQEIDFLNKVNNEIKRISESFEYIFRFSEAVTYHDKLLEMKSVALNAISYKKGLIDRTIVKLVIC